MLRASSGRAAAALAGLPALRKGRSRRPQLALPFLNTPLYTPFEKMSVPFPWNMPFLNWPTYLMPGEKTARTQERQSEETLGRRRSATVQEEGRGTKQREVHRPSGYV